MLLIPISHCHKEERVIAVCSFLIAQEKFKHHFMKKMVSLKSPKNSVTKSMSIIDTIYSRIYARFSACFAELKITNHIVDLYTYTINKTGLLQSSSCIRKISVFNIISWQTRRKYSRLLLSTLLFIGTADEQTNSA